MLRAVTFDVLVVLGCRVQGTALPPAALRRVERAAEIYRSEGASLVIAAGGKAWEGTRESQTFARGLVERGVPVQHIIEEQESLTTRGNARGVARLLRGRTIGRLGVVTCDWHMPRALRLFQRQGITAIALPATSPRRPVHLAAARFVRERLSLALDLLFGVVCVLGALGCRAPSHDSKPGSSQPAASAGVEPAKLEAFLQAELRRDPSGAADDDLLAESAARRAAAVRTLARIADPRSFEPLSKALSDEDADVMAWAAFGMGELCRGHEPEAVRHLALRAASLAAAAGNADDPALGSIALALGHCASDEAETTLRGWLKLRPAVAEPAMLGLGQVARTRKRLDDATIAALLDAAALAPASSALYAIETLPALGGPARARLLEVSSKALEQAGPNRGFAIRALAKAGAEAAAPLRRLLEAETTTDAERADAARSLAALGNAAQTELAAALTSRARKLLDEKAWLTTQHGVVLTLLEGMEPKSSDTPILSELAQLPPDGEAPLKRRKIMLRCRAAAILAGKASASQVLLNCDPSAPAERREGLLALVKVLGRGPLDKARGVRFAELARSSDRLVREAALELLMAHDEAPNIPALLADALATREPGVQATAAKILSRYPSRAAAPQKDDPKAEKPTAAPTADPRVVQALTQALTEVGKSNNIEVSSGLLDAAAALELLGAKPALERACASTNPTLRQHAERGFAALGEPTHRCPSVVGAEPWNEPPAADFKLAFDTDIGPLSITLWGNKSPFATLRLVELARSGFFDGMRIHRVVPGFVVQLGDPDADGFGGPPNLPPLRCQLGAGDFNPGSVGVALAGRDTGSSQFFVTLRRAPHLVGEYSLIGEAEPGWERLTAGDRIVKVSVEAASN
jgi:cyclophilin family peptidyl-prolyl cis-trans isomerase/uncharacterized SAM-binding protein YcdF (DUF218 family)/HEAT repeat protein